MNNNLSSSSKRNNPLRTSSLYYNNMTNDNDTVVSGMTEISGGSFAVNNTNNTSSRQLPSNSNHSHLNNNLFDPIVEEDDESNSKNNNSYDGGNSGGAGSFITTTDHHHHQPPPSPQRRPQLLGSRLNSNNSLISSNNKQQDDQSIITAVTTTTCKYDNTRLITHTQKLNAIQEINVQNYQDDNSILNADEVTSLPEEYVCDEYGIRYHPIKKMNDESLRTTTTPHDEEDSKYHSSFLNSHQNDNHTYTTSPFNNKNRKWYTILTIVAAVTLALCGLILSFTLLMKNENNNHYSSPSSSSTIIANSNINNSGGGYVYLSNQLFGVGRAGGGIVGGQLRQHHQQQQQQFQLSSSSNGDGQYYVGKNSASMLDDVGDSSSGKGSGGGLISERGYTPSNYNGERSSQMASYQTSGASSSVHEFHPPPDYNAQQQQTENVMSATPLTSYIPPSSSTSTNNNGSGHQEPVIIIPSTIEETYMELSILPYNQLTELPVVLSIPYNIDELDNDSNIVNKIFGKCYKLVQCSQEGSEILDREYAQFVVNDGDEEEESRRKLMKLVPKTTTTNGQHEDINKSEHLRSSLTHQDAIQGTTNQEEVTSNQVQEFQEEEDHSTYPSSFDPELRSEVIETSSFVNVDCTTSHGLNRAISSQLLSSNLVDVLHTFNLEDMSRLFHEHNNNNNNNNDGIPYYHGRAIIMVHNPIHYSIIKYNWLRVTNDNVVKMTLEQFASSNYLDDNIFTRTILSKTNNNNDNDGLLLTEIDLEMAKYILKHKFIIGLYDEIESSLQRFELFFGWNNGSYQIGGIGRCQQEEVRNIQGRYYNNFNIPNDEEGTVIQAIMEKNRLDMKLYEYVMYLFDYQGLTLFGVPASTKE